MLSSTNKKFPVCYIYPNSPAIESFRSIQMNIKQHCAGAGQKTVKSILVTSVQPGEGKTTTVSNLAVAFAQEGKRVLLLDGNLRKPALHHIFGISQAYGVSDVLEQRQEVSDMIMKTSISNLSLLPGGTTVLNASQLLITGMGTLLKQLENEYDLILVDSPCVKQTVDAQILAALCGGVLLVIKHGMVNREVIVQAIQRLNSLQANVIGAVLNQSKPVMGGL